MILLRFNSDSTSGNVFIQTPFKQSTYLSDTSIKSMFTA
jgi:hypothetical protein